MKQKVHTESEEVKGVDELEANNKVVGNFMEQPIEAPYTGLVPIPSLLIDRINVDFQPEVSESYAGISSSTAESSANSSAKCFASKVKFSGNVTSARKDSCSTNQTEKYQVHVSATEQQQAEALSKMMDIMDGSTEASPEIDG
ncbi:MAG: DUF2589 domain-containing protein [Bacteroidales bacterium]|nr:DUF2589 domain-containing protein [Bacteroidales bacterium]